MLIFLFPTIRRKHVLQLHLHLLSSSVVFKMARILEQTFPPIPLDYPFIDSQNPLCPPLQYLKKRFLGTTKLLAEPLPLVILYNANQSYTSYESTGVGNIHGHFTDILKAVQECPTAIRPLCPRPDRDSNPRCRKKERKL